MLSKKTLLCQLANLLIRWGLAFNEDPMVVRSVIIEVAVPIDHTGKLKIDCPGQTTIPHLAHMSWANFVVIYTLPSITSPPSSLPLPNPHQCFEYCHFVHDHQGHCYWYDSPLALGVSEQQAPGANHLGIVQDLR